MAPLSSYIRRSFNVIYSSLYKSQYLDFVANGYLIKERRKCLIKKLNKILSGLLATVVLFTSVPVNALDISGSDLSESTVNEEINENVDTSTGLTTEGDSSSTEDTSISDKVTLDSEELSSNDIDADALERTLSSEEKLNNEISLQNDTSEENGEESSTDNWELGLVFYDSTVDNGKTPLTEINWDASDGGYGEGTPRVITVQINYKNTNAVTTYQPGELKLKIDGLLKGAPTNGLSTDHFLLEDFNVSWLIGANDSTHTGYDWDYSCNYVSNHYTSNGRPVDRRININDITFTNANIIEEKSNFEGSIQIVYTVTPQSDNYDTLNRKAQPERFDDSCIHVFSNTISAQIENIAKSNELAFDYRREYIHPWQKNSFTLKKTANPEDTKNSYDGFGENAAEYIWVKYNFAGNGNTSSSYPYISVKNMFVKDSFPEECVVLNEKTEPIESDNGEYVINLHYDYSAYKASIYVGYPISIYNEENNNLTIRNHADLYAEYSDNAEFVYQDDDEVVINLADFRFNYTGNLYGINKRCYSYSNTLYYQSLTGIYPITSPSSTWEIYFTSKNVGIKTDIKVGDDLLYITGEDGEYRKLNDSEYYFSNVKFPSLVDGRGNTISNKYDVELWIRHRGQIDYELYSSFKNTNKTISFSQKDIVGYYFYIKETITDVTAYYETMNRTNFSSVTVFDNISNIAQKGTIYNFCYMQAYQNGILQNEPSLDSYNNLITKDNIATHDQEVYGYYLQRACASKSYIYYNTPQIKEDIDVRKYMSKFTQDAANELFRGTATISSNFKVHQPIISDTSYIALFEGETLNYDEGFTGADYYDLLPLGMELDSEEKDIVNSISTSEKYLWDINKNKINASEFTKLAKENATVEIIKNWKNTGRTWIHLNIDLTKNPVYMLNYSSVLYEGLDWSYNYTVSYDSFLEYGNVWENHVFVDYFGNQFEYETTEGGTYKDPQENDINGNDIEKERMAYAWGTSATITSIISTHQDITKYVQTDKSNYSTGTVKASPDSEYVYKLRVRTGQNDVTNLVIYDSIEEYAQDKEGNIVPAYGTKKHWNGEFLGVDTSYAEKKGYKVKVYYSEDKQAGNLSEDNSWKEYSDSVDKSKVKSLAFEYFNKDDETQKAVLPANSQTYVLVKMKAPPEENRKILSYNGCHTQWQALDDYDRPVDFITGINSNIVKVSLSDYYDLTVNKTWEDENNKWGFRPESIDIILKKDGVEVERKQITKDNLSVTFTDLLVEDSDRYTIEEAPLLLYSSSIEYNELEDCYEVTNTLKDDAFTDISGTKTWVGDKESNRPENITIKLLKDGKVYRTTTTNADKEWKYSFDKVPIYNADETRCIYSVEEIPIEKYTTQYINGNGTDNRNGLAIKFNSQCRTESANYDYVEIYYKQDGQTFKLGKWGGTALAGKTVNVPTNDFYLYWRTDGSQCSYYGFSIDSIESAEVSATGTVATLPNYTATELTGTDYPESPNHGNYGNNLNMLWHYTGTLSSDVPAEGLFNIVNTYEGVDSVNISFIKGIEGTDEAFEKLQLKRDDLYKFQVSMKNRETGDTISVQIDNKNTVTVREVPIGTYTITEKDDMYFDFVSMEPLNSVEGVTFEKVGNDYVLTITKDASEEGTLQIKVNNKIETDRPYEDKEEKENLFKYKDESIEINTYIVYWYDSNGNFIKTPETRTGAVGTTIHATTDDKNISGYKYDESNSLNIESIILSKNEGNKLKLYFNKL